MNFTEFNDYQKAKRDLFSYFKKTYSDADLTSRVFNYTEYNWNHACSERIGYIDLELWEEETVSHENSEGELVEKQEIITDSDFIEEISFLSEGKDFTLAYDKDLDSYYILDNGMKKKYKEEEL